MPIIRSFEQQNKTLEEFYLELTSDQVTVEENGIGSGMLSFISMVNDTFVKTTLYGLTSHYSLMIIGTDDKKADWSVRVYSLGDNKFQFEYKMPEAKSPWNSAIVKGQANSIEEAKDFLIIAMYESEYWEDNKELRELYNKLKKIKTENPKFTLWLEFEAVDFGNWDVNNEFCNVIVDLEDGRHYGINVWTYNFLQTCVEIDKESGENLNGLYQKPPDLFVKELTRDCIERTISELLKIGDLEKVLNSTIGGAQKRS